MIVRQAWPVEALQSSLRAPIGVDFILAWFQMILAWFQILVQILRLVSAWFFYFTR